MTNNEILELIRLDRPNQIINDVISFHMNDNGYYDVTVDMEAKFYDSTYPHHKCVLPYPLSEYYNFTNIGQFKYYGY